jgi:hypothetical protein
MATILQVQIVKTVAAVSRPFLDTPNFGRLRKREVRRILIPRTPVNKPSAQSAAVRFIADSSPPVFIMRARMVRIVGMLLC